MKETAAVWEDIDVLVPWDENPRHNQSAIKKVADSIKRFGFASPIIARKADNMVIAGHTRLEASKLLKLKTVPVRYLDLDPADAKMLALADNKIGEIADWDEDKLDEIIANLGLNADDLEDLGWDLGELDNLFGDVFDSDKDEDYQAIDLKDLDLASEVIFGDCMKKLKEIPSNSIDAIVTDPPYGMSPDGIARTWADIEEGRSLSGFMGKEWDAAVPCHNFFAECFRVLKHGGHMIAFSSTRTVCALGMAAQKGGFLIRDMIHWCYFSGFPKSHNISIQIDKDAGAVREVVGEWKPTGTARPQKNGSHSASKTTSALKNLDYDQNATIPITTPATQDAQRWDGFGTALKPAVEPALLLRKPLEKGLTIAQNVLKHGTGALNIDGCRFGYGDPCWVGPQDRTGFRSVGGFQDLNVGGKIKNNVGFSENEKGRWPANLYQCAKPSTKERDQGLEHLKQKTSDSYMGSGKTRLDGNPNPERANFHPTVKPIKLMRWCCRLIGGQKGSVILDPFGGSGTTGVGAILEGYDCILIEREKEYLPIIDARLKWAKKQYKNGDIDGS